MSDNTMAVLVLAIFFGTMTIAAYFESNADLISCQAKLEACQCTPEGGGE